PPASQDTEFKPPLDGVDGAHPQQLAGVFCANQALLRTAERPDDGIKLPDRLRMARFYILQLAHNRRQVETHRAAPFPIRLFYSRSFVIPVYDQTIKTV